MDYSLILLLISINEIQGYYSDVNETITNNIVQSYISSENGERKQIYLKNIDQSSREPRFISFQTKDDNIEVEIDFAIPFLSIPVKRSLSGAMGTFQNVITVSWK